MVTPSPRPPQIDRIANQGLQCSQAHSASNWTPPGHISIFTGKLPPQHANNGQPFMPNELVSLTEILHDQGYYCLAFYDNPLAGRNINLTQGFDRDYSFFRNAWVYPAPLRLWDELICKDTNAKTYFTLAEKTFQWVEARNGHLFLFINIFETHSPHLIREPYFSKFTESLDREKIGDLEGVQRLCNSLEIVICDSSKFSRFTPESYAFLRAAYDSELAYVDHQFGRFAEKMERNGILDKTLLVVTADQGELLGKYASMGHPKLLLEPVLRIPLIFRYPAKIKPERDEELTSNVDIFPTVLNLMGYSEKIPEDISGMNILETRSDKNRQLLCVHINPQGSCYSLINPQYKLIVNADDSLYAQFPYRELLFDLKTEQVKTLI